MSPERVKLRVAEESGALSESVSFGSRHHWANGVYILGWDLFPDHITLRIFTSRSVSTKELVARLAPFDDVDTTFVPLPPLVEHVDGKGFIEYVPAPPHGLSRLGLRDTRGGAAIFPLRRDEPT